MACPVLVEALLTVQRLPHLAHPVHAVVGLEQRRDPLIEGGIGDRALRRRAGMVGVVGARGDLRAGLGEDGADRLDPELILVRVDVRDQRVRWAVELRREESRRGLQDRVRPPQLTVLPLQLGDPRGRVHRRRRRTRGPLGRVAEPVPQRRPRDPELVTDLVTGALVRQPRVVLHRLVHHPNRALTQLVAVLPRCRHDSSLS